LERIADYLFSHAPDRAPRLIRSIYETPETLLSFPHRGRPGKKAPPRSAAMALTNGVRQGWCGLPAGNGGQCTTATAAFTANAATCFL
jgi:hypothetical protein